MPKCSIPKSSSGSTAITRMCWRRSDPTSKAPISNGCSAPARRSSPHEEGHFLGRSCGDRRCYCGRSRVDSMKGKSLFDFPIHLGLGARAIEEPEFTGPEWYEHYGERHAGDLDEGRLVSLFR